MDGGRSDEVGGFAALTAGAVSVSFAKVVGVSVHDDTGLRICSGIVEESGRHHAGQFNVLSGVVIAVGHVQVGRIVTQQHSNLRLIGQAGTADGCGLAGDRPPDDFVGLGSATDEGKRQLLHAGAARIVIISVTNECVVRSL